MRSKPGVFGQFVNRRMRLSGGAAPAPAFTPSDLFGSDDYGDWWDFRTADGLFIADDGETDPVGENDPVGSAVGRRGSLTVINSDTSTKPLWTGVNLRAENNFSVKRLITPEYSARSVGSSGVSVFIIHSRAGGGSYSQTTASAGFSSSAASFSLTGTSALCVSRGTWLDGAVAIVRGGSESQLFTGTVTPDERWAAVTWDGVSANAKQYAQNNLPQTFATGSSVDAHRQVGLGLAGRGSAGYPRFKGLVFIEKELSEDEIAKLAEFYMGGSE